MSVRSLLSPSMRRATGSALHSSALASLTRFECIRDTAWLLAASTVSDATLDDIREAVATLDKLKQTFRRQLGGAHPKTVAIEGSIQEARMTLLLRASETPSPGSA